MIQAIVRSFNSGELIIFRVSPGITLDGVSLLSDRSLQTPVMQQESKDNPNTIDNKGLMMLGIRYFMVKRLILILIFGNSFDGPSPNKAISITMPLHT
jgi:hypothetical protein